MNRKPKLDYVWAFLFAQIFLWMMVALWPSPSFSSVLIRVGLQELNLSKALQLCWKPPCLYLLPSPVGHSKSSKEQLHSCKQLRSQLGIGLNENQVFGFVPCFLAGWFLVLACSIVYKFARFVICYHRCLLVILSTDIQSTCNWRSFLIMYL